MTLRRLNAADFPQIALLLAAYKAEIGEAELDETAQMRLERAISEERIQFYGCEDGGALIGMCSICITFSTFDCRIGGVLEDFYIRPAERHRGIARRLVTFAREQSGASTLTVGCADCDEEMYRAIGFREKIGNLMAWNPD